MNWLKTYESTHDDNSGHWINNISAKRWFMLTLLLGMTVGTIYAPRASALVPTDIPGDVAGAVTNYNSLCQGNPNKYSYHPWISKAGDPQTDAVIDVPYDTTSVPLQFNTLIFLCHDIVIENGANYPGLPRDGRPTTNALTASYRYIQDVGVSPTGVIAGSPAGSTNTIGYNGQSRYWFGNPNGFTYTSAPLKNNIDITITVRSVAVNNYRNGSSYVCVAGGGAAPRRPPAAPDYGCPGDTSTFRIRLNVGPPITNDQFSCDSVTPSELEAGTTGSFNLIAGIGAPTPLSGGARAAITFNGSEGPMNFVDGSTNVSSSFSVPSAGVYPVSIRFIGGNSGDVTLNCPKITVSKKPYFRVFNGDVLVGSANCPGWGLPTGSAGQILALSNGSGKGAGTQLISQAMGGIDGFSSAQGNVAPAPGPDKGLSFASSGTYGGNFGSGTCPKDSWARHQTTYPSPRSNVGDPNMVTGEYYAAGDLNLSGTVAVGKKLVIYVNGNVTITDSILYAAGATTVQDIPSLTIIARGNIYVQANVSNIDGVLIAQPDASSARGTVYTCSEGGAPPSETYMANNCDNHLTITGSVTARTIKLLRTFGTFKNARNDEKYNDVNAQFTAAERFIFSPEVWIRPNKVMKTPNLGGYDDITSLPPVF